MFANYLTDEDLIEFNRSKNYNAIIWTIYLSNFELFKFLLTKIKKEELIKVLKKEEFIDFIHVNPKTTSKILEIINSIK
jgi:hypothetical protein